jgi:hypothetical protein
MKFIDDGSGTETGGVIKEVLEPSDLSCNSDICYRLFHSGVKAKNLWFS